MPPKVQKIQITLNLPMLALVLLQLPLRTLQLLHQQIPISILPVIGLPESDVQKVKFLQSNQTIAAKEIHQNPQVL